jgi:hypothetical protein
MFCILLSTGQKVTKENELSYDYLSIYNLIFQIDL